MCARLCAEVFFFFFKCVCLIDGSTSLPRKMSPRNVCLLDEAGSVRNSISSRDSPLNVLLRNHRDDPLLNPWSGHIHHLFDALPRDQFHNSRLVAGHVTWQSLLRYHVGGVVHMCVFFSAHLSHRRSHPDKSHDLLRLRSGTNDGVTSHDTEDTGPTRMQPRGRRNLKCRCPS